MRKNASVRKTQGKIFQILKALLRKEIKAEFSVGKEAAGDGCPAKMGRVLHAPPQARETKQCEAERKGKRPTHGDKKRRGRKADAAATWHPELDSNQRPSA